MLGYVVGGVFMGIFPVRMDDILAFQCLEHGLGGALKIPHA